MNIIIDYQDIQYKAIYDPVWSQTLYTSTAFEVAVEQQFSYLTVSDL